MQQQHDVASLEKNVAMIDNLYKQLLPVMRALHAKYPECKHEFTSQIDRSDGFCRMIDLVPNVQQYLMAALDYPEVKPKATLETYAPRTSEIFAQAHALLKQYGKDPIVADSGALNVNDLLEDLLLDTYQGFDALHAPTTQGVSNVTNTGLAAAQAPIKTVPRT